VFSVAAELGGVGDTRGVTLGLPGRLGEFTIMRPWAPQHVLEGRLVAALPSGSISVCHGIQYNNLGAVMHMMGSPYQDYSLPMSKKMRS
jgi:hypothetical protein